MRVLNQLCIVYWYFPIVLVLVQVDWGGVKWCLVAIFVFITFKFWMFIVYVQGLALLDRTRLIWGSNLCNVLHNHEVLTLILFVFVFVNQQVSALDLRELLQWCYVTINLQGFSFFPAPALNWWPVTGLTLLTFKKEPLQLKHLTHLTCEAYFTFTLLTPFFHRDFSESLTGEEY